jgi:hypothetical protein
MDDAFGVRGVECIGDFDSDIEKAIEFEGLPGDEVFERNAVEKLHDNEGFAVLFTDVVDGANVGVIEGGSGLRFPFETGKGLRIFGDRVGKELEDDTAMKTGVVGLIDDAHTTAANSFDDAVMGDGLAEQGVRVGQRW